MDHSPLHISLLRCESRPPGYRLTIAKLVDSPFTNLRENTCIAKGTRKMNICAFVLTITNSCLFILDKYQELCRKQKHSVTRIRNSMLLFQTYDLEFNISSSDNVDSRSTAPSIQSYFDLHVCFSKSLQSYLIMYKSTVSLLLTVSSVSITHFNIISLL